MPWKPITRDELEALIRTGLEDADDAVLRAWSAMRIEPRKWQCSPWGDDGAGFWAIAVRDGRVTWYNDIEDGFNTSPFEQHGIIGEYLCNQGDFSDYLATLPEALAADAEGVGVAAEVVPTALVGPGRIVKRQTTYWTVEPANGQLWRVHFRHEAERHFAEGFYSSIELHDSHPLLSHHSEIWVSLYFRGTPRDPIKLEETIADVVRRATDGWRDMRAYRNSGAGLAGGYGVLMRAPRSIGAAVQAELEKALISCSVLSEASTGPLRRVLVLGRNFVVADGFCFEQLET